MTVCFFYCSGNHRDLHSFPHRRSSDLPPGSALAKWRAGVIGKAKLVEVQKLAAAVQRVLLPKGEGTDDADKRMREIFTSFTGPLKWLEFALDEVKLTDVEAVAPSVLEYKLPGELVADGEVVVTAQLHPEKGRKGTAQFLVDRKSTRLNSSHR